MSKVIVDGYKFRYRYRCKYRCIYRYRYRHRYNYRYTYNTHTSNHKEFALGTNTCTYTCTHSGSSIPRHLLDSREWKHEPVITYKCIFPLQSERRLGKREKKLGIRSSSTWEVIVENLKLPKDQLIGELGKGYKIAIETLNEGRIGIASQMLGLSRGAFDAAFRYAGERSQFGRAIKDFQSIQFEFAKLASEIEVAKQLRGQ